MKNYGVKLIRSITDAHDEIYIKIKLNSDNKLPLNKKNRNSQHNNIVRADFHENNKYYLHVLLDECLYKL